jgi:hypothetical protein
MKYFATAAVFLAVLVGLYGTSEVESIASRKQSVSTFAQPSGKSQ